jgi:hypothetical protein
MLKTRVAIGLSCALCLCVALFYVVWHRVQQNRILEALSVNTPPVILCKHKALDDESYQTLYQRHLDFKKIWLSRDKRDVTADIIPFLNGSNSVLCDSAIRTLATLETPAAETALANFAVREAERYDAPQEKVLSQSLLGAALSRVCTRDQNAMARVKALARVYGLDFGTLIKLSQRVNNSRKQLYHAPGNVLLDQIVDLLYVMATKGHDVSDVTDKLTFSRPQQIKLQCGTLPPEQQAKLIVDYLFEVTKPGDEKLLPSFLLGLGEAGHTAIKEKLLTLSAKPEDYKVLIPYPNYPNAFQTRIGYKDVFRVAEETGNTDFIAIFRSLSSNPRADMHISACANQSYQGMTRTTGRKPPVWIF